MTVELRGRVVALAEIKRVLRQKKNLTQMEVAAETASFTEDKQPLHQTSVSGYLGGKTPIHPAFLAYLESKFSDDELDEMGGVPVPEVERPAPPALPPAPPPPAALPAPAEEVQALPATAAEELAVMEGPGGVPFILLNPPRAQVGAAAGGGVFMGAFSGRTAAPPPAPEVPESTAVVVAAPAVIVSKRLKPFPAESAYKMLSMVRKAQKAKTINSGFSLRKLELWAKGFVLLQAEGFGYEESVSGAFHLSVEGKTYGAERKFLRDGFQAVFAYEVAPPKVNAHRARSEGNRHPATYIVEPMIREGLPVWCYGVTGTGKSYGIETIAQRLGRPFIRVQCGGEMRLSYFLGGMAAREGSTLYEYGPLPLAMKAGAVLALDEFTTLSPDIHPEFQAVLEGKPLVLAKNRGEVIHAAPGFTLVVTDNTLGLGEAPEYIGTQPVNEAIRDRFLFMEFDYMSKAQELRALEMALAPFCAARGWELEEMAAITEEEAEAA